MLCLQYGGGEDLARLESSSKKGLGFRVILSLILLGFKRIISRRLPP